MKRLTLTREQRNAKVLRYVAEHSPKTWATAIRKRFETVLKALRRYEVELNSICITLLGNVRTNPNGKYYDQDHFSLGCPHCNDFQCQSENGNCLYVKACKLYGIRCYTYDCASIRFGGFTLDDVSGSDVSVTLASDGVKTRVAVLGTERTTRVLKQLEQCVAFCKGHIAWANKPYWGRKYKK